MKFSRLRIGFFLALLVGLAIPAVLNAQDHWVIDSLVQYGQPQNTHNAEFPDFQNMLRVTTFDPPCSFQAVTQFRTLTSAGDTQICLDPLPASYPSTYPNRVWRSYSAHWTGTNACLQDPYYGNVLNPFCSGQGTQTQVCPTGTERAGQTISVALSCNPGLKLPKSIGSPCEKINPCTVGNPIDVATGNKHESVIDYESAGMHRLSFVRSYNSLSNSSTSLGRNWRSNFDRKLKVTAIVSGQPSAINIERADGQTLSFNLVSGSWKSDSDVELKLVASGSTWILTDSSDSAETFTNVDSSSAALTSIRYRDGYTQTLQYDVSGKLTLVTDSFARTLGFTYQGALLVTLTTPESLVLTYGFSASNPSSGVLDRLASVSYSTSPSTSIAYRYENTALPFALTGMVDENGTRFASWNYDGKGRAVTSYHAGSAELTIVAYNDFDDTRTVVDSLGKVQVYHFSILQGVPKVALIERAQ